MRPVPCDAEALLAEAEEHYAEETYFGVYSRRFGQKLRSARRRIDLLRSYQPTGRLLDIGCGLGDTLIAAREAGYDASGLDIGAYPVQHCQELGFEVRQASVTDTGLAAEASTSSRCGTCWSTSRGQQTGCVRSPES